MEQELPFLASLVIGVFWLMLIFLVVVVLVGKRLDELANEPEDPSGPQPENTSNEERKEEEQGGQARSIARDIDRDRQEAAYRARADDDRTEGAQVWFCACLGASMKVRSSRSEPLSIAVVEGRALWPRLMM